MEQIRWNIAVSAETDKALRLFLTLHGGGRKGDLSRFIEQAVRAHILELTADQVKKTIQTSVRLNLIQPWTKRCTGRAAKFEIITSEIQLNEIRRASRYPKLPSILQAHQVGAMINNLQRAIALDRVTSDVEADDPDDTFLLAMAMTGLADYLVTGDRRAGLLQRKSYGKTRIVIPAVFVTELL